MEKDKLADDLIRDLCSQLDEHCEKWDIYRNAMHHWTIRVTFDGVTENMVDESFIGALRKGLQWKPLPLVPWQPPIQNREGYEVVKNGSYWRVTYYDRDVCVQFKTKREATEFIERHYQWAVDAREKWFERYGWSLAKIEGVDFRWA